MFQSHKYSILQSYSTLLTDLNSPPESGSQGPATRIVSEYAKPDSVLLISLLTSTTALALINQKNKKHVSCSFYLGLTTFKYLVSVLVKWQLYNIEQRNHHHQLWIQNLSEFSTCFVCFYI